MSLDNSPSAESNGVARVATAADTAALRELVTAIDLFPPAEIAEVNQMLSAHLSEGTNREHYWVIYEEATHPVGLAYYAPERMTEGTWNLHLIAILPACRNRGHGTLLLRYVEQTLRAAGERLLLVETSGLAQFDATRAFYSRNGYNEEARIRDFYRTGEDKIIFRKKLSGSVE